MSPPKHARYQRGSVAREKRGTQTREAQPWRGEFRDAQTACGARHARAKRTYRRARPLARDRSGRLDPRAEHAGAEGGRIPPGAARVSAAAGELFGKTNEMADPTWDTSKENFQPLRKGRGAKALEQGASDVPRGERATKIKEERRYARPSSADLESSPTRAGCALFRSIWHPFGLGASSHSPPFTPSFRAVLSGGPSRSTTATIRSRCGCASSSGRRTRSPRAGARRRFSLCWSGARASCRRFRDTRTTRDTSASGSSTLTAARTRTISSSSSRRTISASATPCSTRRTPRSSRFEARTRGRTRCTIAA